METTSEPVSLLSQSLTQASPGIAALEQQTEQRKAQYDNVKMRYFSSLGMAKPGPTMSSSVPTNSMLSLQNSPPSEVFAFEVNAHTQQQISKRDRTKTAPLAYNYDNLQDKDARKRTTSVPIPIGAQGNTKSVPMAISVGTYLLTKSHDDSEDEDSSSQDLNKSMDKVTGDLDEDIMFQEESSNEKVKNFTKESPTGTNANFVPPHEMLAKNMKEGFNVGTAHSVAVWENRRRPKGI